MIDADGPARMRAAINAMNLEWGRAMLRLADELISVAEAAATIGRPDLASLEATVALAVEADRFVRATYADKARRIAEEATEAGVPVPEPVATFLRLRGSKVAERGSGPGGIHDRPAGSVSWRLMLMRP